MSQQLRPLNLGEILDRTAELYRTNFLLFSGIAAIFAGAMLGVQMLYLGVLALLGYPHGEPKLQWVVAVAAVLELLLILVIAGLSIAANCRAVSWIHLGEPATVRAAAGGIMPRMRRYLWVMTLAGLRAWGPLALLYVAMLAVVFTVLPKGFFSNPAAIHGAPPNPSALITAGIGVLILVPLFIAATVYGTLMSLRYSLAVPACVVEEIPARQAIKRSIELSRGTRGRIFVLALLVYAVRLLLGIILGFPFILFAIKHRGSPLPLGLMAIQQISTFIVNTLIGPIYSTGLTLFYFDQRIRKEGFDIEWMMRAAGLVRQPELSAPEHS